MHLRPEPLCTERARERERAREIERPREREKSSKQASERVRSIAILEVGGGMVHTTPLTRLLGRF
jgi:hypothetical protein